MKKNCPNTLALINELSRETPDKQEIKRLCRNLHIDYHDDLTEMMASVLQRVTSIKSKPIKPKELDR